MREEFTNRIVFFVFAAVSVAVIWSSWPLPRVHQPTAFPHVKHVALKVSCVSCHTGAFCRSPRSHPVS